MRFAPCSSLSMWHLEENVPNLTCFNRNRHTCIEIIDETPQFDSELEKLHSQIDILKKDLDAARLDGWQNVVSGLNVLGKDQNRATNYVKTKLLGDQELTNMYSDDGLTTRIINIPIDDALKKGIIIDTGEVGKKKEKAERIQKKLRSLKAMSRFKYAQYMADLYGGSLALMGTTDPGKFSTPLNKRRLKSIDTLKVYTLPEIIIEQDDLDTRPDSPTFGEPEYYNIQPYGSTDSFKVHKSRVLKFTGIELPPLAVTSDELKQRAFGGSRIQNIYKEIQYIGTSFENVQHILNNFVTTILQFAKLEELIAGGNSNIVTNRISQIAYARNLLNMIILGPDDKFDKTTSTVTGLPELLDRFMMRLSSVTGIPVTRLFGRSAAGHNATGFGDRVDYYDMLRSIQENTLREPLEYLIDLIIASNDGPKMKSGAWELIFPPTEEVDEKTRAEIQKLDMETLAGYAYACNQMPPEFLKKAAENLKVEVPDMAFAARPVKEQSIEPSTGSYNNANDPKANTAEQRNPERAKPGQEGQSGVKR